MVDSIGLEGDWSTAPKPKPTTGGSGGAWSDTGDYGTAYYWYDEDGDIWYWNGYEDIFIGFGDDYYIEDGQYYESNDAGGPTTTITTTTTAGATTSTTMITTTTTTGPATTATPTTIITGPATTAIPTITTTIDDFGAGESGRPCETRQEKH